MTTHGEHLIGNWCEHDTYSGGCILLKNEFDNSKWTTLNKGVITLSSFGNFLNTWMMASHNSCKVMVSGGGGMVLSVGGASVAVAVPGKRFISSNSVADPS